MGRFVCVKFSSLWKYFYKTLHFFVCSHTEHNRKEYCLKKYNDARNPRGGAEEHFKQTTYHKNPCKIVNNIH